MYYVYRIYPLEAAVLGGLAVSAQGKLTLLVFSQLTQVYCLPCAPSMHL